MELSSGVGLYGRRLKQLVFIHRYDFSLENFLDLIDVPFFNTPSPPPFFQVKNRPSLYDKFVSFFVFKFFIGFAFYLDTFYFFSICRCLSLQI